MFNDNSIKVQLKTINNEESFIISNDGLDFNVILWL
jgi:hypothetical protein